MPLASPTSIAAATRPGVVDLTVSDLGRSRAFYEAALGLRARELDDGDLELTAPGGGPLVRLHGDPSAPPLNRRATGLYHLAILLPSRLDLAHALGRLVRARWPLDGASDHLVSEALYLSDPDGNGIELYRDRPRHEWRYDGDQLQMATLRLDLDDLVRELAPGAPIAATAPAGTVMGHVHLQVAELDSSEAFYHGILGFDVVVRGYPGALFVSAGGYHHDIGLNTWHSAGAGPAAPGSVGMRAFEIVVPEADELERILERIRAAGLATEPAGGTEGGAAGSSATAVRDPSGIVVHLRCP